VSIKYSMRNRFRDIISHCDWNCDLGMYVYTIESQWKTRKKRKDWEFFLHEFQYKRWPRSRFHSL